jgi:hypothetical protein
MPEDGPSQDKKRAKEGSTVVPTVKDTGVAT